MTPRTIRNLTAMIAVLDFGAAGEPPEYGEPAWLDVCTRLRDQLSPEHFQRFADGMRLWAATAGLQILNHVQPEPIEIRHYETIRRHTSGMNPCLALSDAAMAGAITPEEYHDPAVAELRRHTNNVVCWSNDIQSLVVEARQPGQFRDMVTLYAARGLAPQDAVHLVAERIRAEIAAFVRLADIVRTDAGPRLRGCLAGLRHWMRGYQDWVVHDTGLYDPSHAEQDSDDRGVPTDQ